MNEENTNLVKRISDKRVYKRKVRQSLYNRNEVKYSREEEVKSIFERSLGKVLIAVLTVYSLLGVVTFFAYENNILKFSIHLSIPLIFSMVFLLVNLISKIIEEIEVKNKKKDVIRFDKAAIFLFMVIIGFLIFSWLLSDINFGNGNLSDFEKNLSKFLSILFEGSIMIFFQFLFILNVSENPINNREIKYVGGFEEEIRIAVNTISKRKNWMYLLLILFHISANIIIFAIFFDKTTLFDKITEIYATEFSISIALYLLNLILRMFKKNDKN